MESDVKVGCQLSGGVDSSLVAYYGANNVIKQLNDSVSIVFNDERYSEEQYIDFITNITKINSYRFNFDTDFFNKNFEKAIWHYETIVTYHNIIALLLLTQEAKKHVTVLLSGEGADELFGGYTWFENGYYASEYLKYVKKSNSRSITLEKHYRGLENAKSFSEFVVKAADTVPKTESFRLLGSFGYDEIVKKRVDFAEHFHGSDLDRQLKYEMSTRLPALLLRQDKMSMANSIENRVPLLDNDIINFAFTLPSQELLHIEKNNEESNNFMMNKVTGKYILKKICAKRYGKDFAFRRKMGFPLPFHEYIYSNCFKEYFYEQILPSIRTRGLMNYNEVKSMYEKGHLNSNKWSYVSLFKAICCETWCKLFIDRKRYDNQV